MSTAASSLRPSFFVPQRLGVRALCLGGASLVALFLIAAGVFKVTEPNPAQPVFDRVVGVLEIPIALALVVYHGRWWAWLGTATLFGGFVGHTAFMVWRGANSCGCFGAAETPPTLMLTLEIAVAALAILATNALARRGGFAGVALTFAAGAGLAGAAFGVMRTDPRPEEFAGDPASMLVGAEALEEVAGADLTGPQWLIVVHDPDAAPEEEGAASALDRLAAYDAEHPSDPNLRVEMISTDETADLADVPGWAWPSPPLAMRVQAGQVAERFDAANLPDPYSLRENLSSRPTPIRELMGLPRMADIRAMESERPAWLVYVYNPNCAYCKHHLEIMDAYETEFGADDAALRVRSVSMADLQESAGIPVWAWPGVPTTFLVEGGRVTERYGARSTPDPALLRESLLAE